MLSNQCFQNGFNKTSNRTLHTAAEPACRRPKCNRLLSVITFGLKYNKLLSVITFGLKCSNVMPTSSGTSLTCHWLLVASCVTSLKGEWRRCLRAGHVTNYVIVLNFMPGMGGFLFFRTIAMQHRCPYNRVYTVRSGWLQNWTSVAELRFGKSTKYERSKYWNLRYSVQII